MKPVNYNDYLKLGKLLECQDPISTEKGISAHDEMLFIITHQAYELWFRQILHELDSVMEMFRSDSVDEKNIGIAVARFDRIIEIQKVLIDQIRILETMTPLDFLDFRNLLIPASGFQSFQFRKIEVKLGLKEVHRITYNNKSFITAFPENQQEDLKKLLKEKALFDLLEDWLERTPFLELGNFNFIERYKEAVENMLSKEKSAIQSATAISEEDKAFRVKMIDDTHQYFENIFKKEKHEELRKEGKLRLSYKATIAALLIHLYRDQPILHLPYTLLSKLVDMDELFTTWRYRHSMMVLRMLGKKAGTGGSSGHDYLSATAEKHHIFSDFYNLSTLLIPRSQLPELPEEMKKNLAFYYTVKTRK